MKISTSASRKGHLLYRAHSSVGFLILCDEQDYLLNFNLCLYSDFIRLLLYFNYKMNCKSSYTVQRKGKSQYSKSFIYHNIEGCGYPACSFSKKKLFLCSFFSECLEYLLLRAPVRRKCRKDSLLKTRKASNDQK